MNAARDRSILINFTKINYSAHTHTHNVFHQRVSARQGIPSVTLYRSFCSWGQNDPTLLVPLRRGVKSKLYFCFSWSFSMLLKSERRRWNPADYNDAESRCQTFPELLWFISPRPLDIIHLFRRNAGKGKKVALRFAGMLCSSKVTFTSKRHMSFHWTWSNAAIS